MAMPNWISVNPDGGTSRTSVSVTAVGNFTRTRSGTLTVKTASGLSKMVPLLQGGFSTPISVIVGGSGGYLEKITIGETQPQPT